MPAKFTIVYDDACTYCSFPMVGLRYTLRRNDWCLRIMLIDCILPVAPEGMRMYACYNKRTMQHEGIIVI